MSKLSEEPSIIESDAPDASDVFREEVNGFRERLKQLEPVRRVSIPGDFADSVRSTDHTALGDVNEETIISLCREAASSDPYPNSVCVQGKKWATLADETFKALGCRDGIAVCAVGERHFPKTALSPVDAESELGYKPEELPARNTAEEKAQDAIEALEVADIFDMVLNPQLILEGRLDEAVDEIKNVRSAMDSVKPEAPLRVISSTGLLRAIGGEEMVRRVCEAVSKSAEGLSHGSIVMKTETGFIVNPKGGKFGATVEDISLMRDILPENVEIKASGGVSATNSREIKAAGADYIGASGLLRGFLKQESSGGY